MFSPAGMKGAMGAWPSVTKMSPLGAVITSLGELKCVSSSPRWPAVPSVISTLPAGDSFGHLQALGAILADGAVGHPDIAAAVDMQAMREYEQAGTDALERFAGR